MRESGRGLLAAFVGGWACPGTLQGQLGCSWAKDAGLGEGKGAGLASEAGAKGRGGHGPRCPCKGRWRGLMEKPNKRCFSKGCASYPWGSGLRWVVVLRWGASAMVAPEVSRALLSPCGGCSGFGWGAQGPGCDLMCVLPLAQSCRKGERKKQEQGSQHFFLVNGW